MHKHGQAQALHTQATSLVHEAYLRLFDHERTQVGDRAHFMARAARAMRSFLVDQARSRQTARRCGGWKRIPLDDAVTLVESRSADLLDLDDAPGLHSVATLPTHEY